MSIEKTYLEWYKPANQIFRIGFGAHEELIDAETTLDPDGNTPTVEVHELITEFPETWSKLDTVTPSAIGVVDDPENEMENGAVQFRLAADPDNDPPPGRTYSIFCMADREDDPTLQVATRVWLEIMP